MCIYRVYRLVLWVEEVGGTRGKREVEQGKVRGNKGRWSRGSKKK